MSCDDNILYNNTHPIEIINGNGNNGVKNVLIRITRHPKHLQIKLRDINDFSFNFTTNIDWCTFETMKNDQCLEISYEEFHIQLIELLKQTLNREMLLRIEHHEISCKMVFYERSRIKSLIFLIIHLNLTNQREIIEEMSFNITQLKEINNGINSQILSLRTQLREKEVLLDTALTTNHHLEKRFIQDIKSVEESFLKNLMRIDHFISTKIDNLIKRHSKLMRDVDILKRGSKFKEGLYSETLLDLDKAKSDNLKQIILIEDLRREMNDLGVSKERDGRKIEEQQQEILLKLNEIEILNATINELRRDNLEATKIIAQKAKTHDEIAKDLVQANTMLVNFTNQYDVMFKEIEQLKQIVTAQERTVQSQTEELKGINKEFEEYKKRFNEENLSEIRSDLFKAKSRVEELEKQNREAVKINTLLTRKLANGDTFGNMNYAHPK